MTRPVADSARGQSIPLRMSVLLPALAALMLAGASVSVTPAHAACDDPPPAVRDIIADRFYVDTASSTAGKAIVARNKTALATLDRTLGAILAMADKGLAGDRESAACAGHWLAVWAKGGAMMGSMSSRQAEVERKVRTAGMAVGYLKIRTAAEPGDRAAIDAWLDALADRVVADQGWPEKRNNHVYWAGFAAGAAGTATGATRHLAYSRRAFEAGMTDIRPDGTLPMELARRQKALEYHTYALAPLVMSAELAALRGEDWYKGEGEAIHRLAARILAGLSDPRAFAELAGEPSVIVPRGGLLGWLAFYRLRFPDRVEGAPTGPFRYPWLGGNLTATANAWVKR
ncbi:MAG: poly(beta-D-mannuronate) lyase [Acetobacteraceae bacterium]|nr:poly(beta-D-mannuronate) lyase [Acetobacteraceae bacterium]